MLEILIFLGVLGSIGSRAHQRGVNKATYIGAAAGGFFVILFLSAAGLGFAGLFLRWLWVGGVFLVLEKGTQGGQKIGDTWRCPDCLMFNDPGTLRCLCGHVHPEARAVVEAPPVEERAPDAEPGSGGDP